MGLWEKAINFVTTKSGEKTGSIRKTKKRLHNRVASVDQTVRQATGKGKVATPSPTPVKKDIPVAQPISDAAVKKAWDALQKQLKSKAAKP